jgi:hypothetical protein
MRTEKVSENGKGVRNLFIDNRVPVWLESWKVGPGGPFWGRQGKTWGERDGRRTEASFITY